MVGLYSCVESLEYLIDAGKCVHAHPPFSVSHLDDLLSATFTVIEGKMFFLGDFNVVVHSSLYRSISWVPLLPCGMVGYIQYGFQDVWRTQKLESIPIILRPIKHSF